MAFPTRWVAAAGACGLAACSMDATVTMYPVEGPLSKERPLPVVYANVHDVQANTGAFDLVLPNGELCKGQWSSAAGRMIGTVHTSLLTQYGTVTGLGTYVGTSGGTNRGEAFAMCNGSTTIQAEFYTGSGTANGYGVAKDSNGNVFKMLF